MFRTLWLMKRRPGMSPEDFRDYYETRHRLIGEEHGRGHANFYARYYLHPMEPGGVAPPYDVMMQLAFPDRTSFEVCTAPLANDPALLQLVVEDEERLFDRPSMLAFEAQDSFSTLQPIERGDGIFRTIWFARRRPGTSHEQCRAYYEHKHRLLGEYIMNGYAFDYQRHYLRPLMPDAPEPPYDFVMQMNFPSRDRYEAMAAAIAADPTLAKLLAEDEARYLDPVSAVHFRAEMCESEMGDSPYPARGEGGARREAVGG